MCRRKLRCKFDVRSLWRTAVIFSKELMTRRTLLTPYCRSSTDKEPHSSLSHQAELTSRQKAATGPFLAYVNLCKPLLQVTTFLLSPLSVESSLPQMYISVFFLSIMYPIYFSISRVSYIFLYISCLLYISQYLVSPIYFSISCVSYIFLCISCLIYLSLYIVSPIYFSISCVSYIFLCISCLLYLSLYLVSPISPYIYCLIYFSLYLVSSISF